MLFQTRLQRAFDFGYNRRPALRKAGRERCTKLAIVGSRSGHTLRAGEVVPCDISSVDDTEGDEVTFPGRGRNKKPPAASAANYECVRIHPDGRIATVYLKRRDLLRLFSLDPRDLRRIDPNLQYTRTSPSMYVRESVLLVQLSGIRLIITAQTALLLDPNGPAARQFLGEIIPKLQVSAGQRLMQGFTIRQKGQAGGESRGGGLPSDGPTRSIPFELSVLEAALLISVAKLDQELVQAQERVQTSLLRLPKDITPQYLDDLRKAKAALVELESKSEAHRELLEGIMDDEEELKDFNLSSRVLREERRRQRERGRLERELNRERGRSVARPSGSASASGNGGDAVSATAGVEGAPGARGDEAPLRGAGGVAAEARATSRRSSPGDGNDAVVGPQRAGAGQTAPAGRGYGAWQKSVAEDLMYRQGGPEGVAESSAAAERDGGAAEARLEAASGADAEAGRVGRVSSSSGGDGDEIAASWDPQRGRGRGPTGPGTVDYHAAMLNRIEASQSGPAERGEEGYEETGAMQELRALFEAEQEEQELQEVEDLLEFYLQRATAIQTEAERLLDGARDLEESIGLALSARRFEVQRLELRLSIGSFAAALGAVVAGIFGMNLRSTFESSVVGFWGTTAFIVAACTLVYYRIYQWTRHRKILV